MTSPTLDSTYLDSWLTRNISAWLTHYPDVLLNWESFYNLLGAGPVLCHTNFFYPGDVSLGLWHREGKKLQSMRKIVLVDSDRDTETASLNAEAFFFDKDNEDLLHYDFISLFYCMKHQVPFRLSKSGMTRIDDVTMVFSPHLQSGLMPPIFSAERKLNQIVEWIVQVEVPELEKRTRELRRAKLEDQYKELIQTGRNDLMRLDHPSLMDARAGKPIYPTREEFIRKFEDINEQSVYISPPELIDLLHKDKALETLRHVLRECRAVNPADAEVRSLLKEKWDRIAGQLAISQFVFGGIDLALLPFGRVGNAISWVTKPIEYVVNTWLKSSEDWLITLNEFNKHIRNS